MSISSVDSTSLHVKPAVDLNITAEANRILHVLNKVINRSKFIGVLNKYIKDDGRLLKTVLDEDSCQFVLHACQKYFAHGNKNKYSVGSLTQSSYSVDQKNSNISEDDDGLASESSSSKSGSQTPEQGNERNDTELSRVLYTLEDITLLQDIAKNSANDPEMMSPQLSCFIDHLKEFRDRMNFQLSENSTQFKNREKYLRETYEKNLKAKKEIERLEEELVVTKTEANVCLIGRNILINRHQNKIEKIIKNSSETIEKRIHESEKSMVNDWKESLIQQSRLKQDFQQASEKYTNMLKDHMAAEKVLRAKRAKTENQVLGWIQKFDLEIGEKQAEEEEVQALLDKETNEVNEIQSKLDEQEEEYDDLMQEKAAYEEEMLERRLYQFVINRSARSIQRTFRMYKARKLAKKMGRKGKKGKK
ncbi:hypothetical protein RUM44_009246 [Polyplax serrata]|uniref:Dynein regulatory complex protein 10 n=1 Tax=Polyplax serrata TaxID=468196 RepID=A0ABR1AS54_POLSC